MNYTTLEQSKKLLELGLDPKTADMYYAHFIRMGSDTYDETEPLIGEFDYPYEFPCWSLGVLIDLMPHEIKEDGDTYRLLITHKLAQYPRLTTLWPSLYNSHADSTFEAAYNMMVWLLENKYIKTE